jgi:hypothetical protein
MKITKRQLRRIIHEAIAGVAAGPNKGSTFLDLTMRAIEASDYRKAASYIMDSFMIDDIFPEDEDALISALSALPSARRSPADVEAVADQWIAGIRKEMGDYSSSPYGRKMSEGLKVRLKEYGRHDPDSGYDELRQDRDDEELYSITREEAESYLRDRADSYRKQNLTGKEISMLLHDDFMDDLGSEHHIEDFRKVIDELIMGESKKITKRQLRKIVREACALQDHGQEEMHVSHMEQSSTQPAVPSPQDYDAVRSFMNANPDLIDLGLNMVMDLVGVSCERSTAQAVIDHLQGMLHGADVLSHDQPEMMIPPEVLGIGGI